MHLSVRVFLITVAVILFSLRLFAGENAGFRVAGETDRQRVEILSDAQTVLRSPAEGLWSIACGWQNGWPSDWHHASPARVEFAGEWTILRGELQACGGTWILRDAYRTRGRVVHGVRRFEWKGPERAEKVTLSVRFQAQARQESVLLPGIIYYGNPSGARSGKVPVFSGKPGEEVIFEEHRFPMPFAGVELAEGGKLRGAALHTLPSPAPFGNLKDQWWSLGVAAREGGVELLALSGPCASNGKRSVIKAVQPGFKPYDHAYLNLPAGAIIEKTFFLEAFPVENEGSGFRRPVHTALELFSPSYGDEMPDFAEILRAKYRFAKSRWHESGGVAGFKKYPDRSFFVMGWAGQSEAPGYALQVLSEGLGDASAVEMASKTLDFLSGAPFYEGGFHTWYDYEKNEWSRHEPLSQGQAMLNFARAIRVGRKGGLDTSRWEVFLHKASEFHAGRILSPDWEPLSTSEAFFIAPLVESYKLFGVETFRQAAMKAGEVYARRHIGMLEPYWGGTLDAQCEDKEGAWAAFEGFLALYEMTGEARHLLWAEHACDVVLSYVVVWDIDLPAGRLRDHFFRTRGWTVVSAQNQHIDVYGVIMAPAVYRMGQILDREDLKRLAILMYRSCGQLTDPYGSQGEQPHHTNYAQRGDTSDVFSLRGGYREDWTVFWITAHFLNAGAQFLELGVPVWE